MNKPRIHYLALQVTGSCNVSQNEWIKHNMINGKQITEVVGPPLSLSLSLSLSLHLEGQWHLGVTQTAHRNDQPIVSWEAKLAERQIKCPE